MTTVQRGARALLTYPEGDCDWVIVRRLTHAWADVEVPGKARPLRVVVEDLGIGVDDTLRVVFDDGCTTLTHPTRCPRCGFHAGQHSEECPL